MLLKNKAAISALIAAAVTTTAAQAKPDDEENIFFYDKDSTKGSSNWFWGYKLDEIVIMLRWPNGDECLAGLVPTSNPPPIVISDIPESEGKCPYTEEGATPAFNEDATTITGPWGEAWVMYDDVDNFKEACPSCHEDFLKLGSVNLQTGFAALASFAAFLAM